MVPGEMLMLLQHKAASGDPEWVAELANFRRWGNRSFPPMELYERLAERLAKAVDTDMPSITAPEGLETLPEFTGAIDDLLSEGERG